MDSQSASRLAAMVELTKSELEIAIEPDRCGRRRAYCPVAPGKWDEYIVRRDR